jgi:hypothetical protein
MKNYSEGEPHIIFEMIRTGVVVVGCVIGWLTDWLTRRLVPWLIGRRSDWLSGVDWLTGWLVDWLAG